MSSVSDLNSDSRTFGVPGIFKNQRRAGDGWRQRESVLRRMLLKARYGVSPGIFEPRSGIRRDRSNWVWMLVDETFPVVCEDDTMIAYRAITRRGRFIWYVYRNGKEHGYHARSSTVEAAFEEARAAIDARRAARLDWEHVLAFARDLRAGRAKATVRRSDAYASPLCDEGVDRFMETLRLAHVEQMNGRALAWLMLLDGQIGYVLHAYLKRVGAL